MEKSLCPFGQVLFDELEQIAVRRGGFASLRWLSEENGAPKDVRDGIAAIKKAEANAKEAEANAKEAEAKAKEAEANAKDAEANAKEAKEAEANAKEAEAKAKEAEAKAKEAEAKAKEAEAAAKELENAVNTTKQAARAYADRVLAARRSLQEFARVVAARRRTAWQVTDLAAKVSATATKLAVERLDQARDAIIKAPANRVGFHSFRGKTAKSKLQQQWDAAQSRYKKTLEQDPTPDARENRRLRLHRAWTQFKRWVGSADAAASRFYEKKLRSLNETVKKADAAQARLKAAAGFEPEIPDLLQRADQGCSNAEAACDAVVDAMGKAGNPDAVVAAAEDLLKNAKGPLSDALKLYKTLLEQRKVAIDLCHEARCIATVDPPPPTGFERLRHWFGLRRPSIVEYPNLLFEIDDLVTDAARQTALELNTVGLAFSGGGIRSATFNLGVLQGLASLGLLRRVDYLSTVSGGGYIGSWLAGWVRREGGQAGDPEPTVPSGTGAGAPTQTQDSTACDEKRRRTARSLENVEAQLNPNRWVQKRAERRWVTGEEIASGVEGQGRLITRVMEEEPQPIHHLRQFSNYLAPKVGLLSSDTWTAFTVYLRNLMLNQLILLPLFLALVLIPRCLLVGFGLDQTDARWLPLVWWTVALVVGALTILASSNLSKFVRSLFVRRRRPNQSAATAALGGWDAFRFASAWILAPLTAAASGFFMLRRPPRLELKDVEWHVFFEWGTALVMIGAGVLAFWGIYRVITKLRASRGRAHGQDAVLTDRSYEASLGFVTTWILAPLAVATFCLSVLFAHQTEKTTFSAWFLPSSLLLWPWTIGAHQAPIAPKEVAEELIRLGYSTPRLFRTAALARVTPLWLRDLGASRLNFSQWTIITALCIGTLVGVLRMLTALAPELRRQWLETSVRGEGLATSLRRRLKNLGRASKQSFAPFVSGLIGAAGLYYVLAMIRRGVGEQYEFLSPLLATIGVPLGIVAAGVGSSIEVGLVGGYEEEDMREWRASLGAYFLMFASAWAVFFGLSLYSPLLIWATSQAVAAALAAGWISASTLGVLAGWSARTDARQRRGPLDVLALAAPAVFLTGLLIVIALLACALQGVVVLAKGVAVDPATYLGQLTRVAFSWRTWLALIVCVLAAAYNCFKIDVNLFSLNFFYSNRLVRCYLGASRPRTAPDEGRPNFAPSHCPVPARRPNPLTGFDPDDDFPIKELAVVRTWNEQDLVCDYRGPYHLINTAMNLVAGSELAWQERMAESFVLSPLYCGSQSTGYRKAVVTRGDVEDAAHEREDDQVPERGLVKGYGGDLRLGAAVAISGAAASPNMGYHSSPLVTMLMTIFNVRLGMWLPNPAKSTWRQVGPGFARYLIDELTGRTTDKGQYVYLSDGGHFENLGVYELVRRRCRFIVVCDCGADPEFAFWDLGGLVRKCRQDFGVRIEIDIAPLLKASGTCKSQRHCAVGQIHYGDVDENAAPGVLLYLKPSLTGDEPSDVRNYVVHHPDFPHEPTSDQFFSESQFESYRQLGEHTAEWVFREAGHDQDAADAPTAETLFRRLKRRWSHPPTDADNRLQESVGQFLRVHDAIRNDAHLDRLSRQLYPELYNDEENAPIVRAELHSICQMLQAMENAWLGVDLEEFADHPMNRGWMNVFRRWTSSKAFQDYWPALRGEFSEGFVQFCENELNLKTVRVETRRISETNLDTESFKRIAAELDQEFLLEWPALSWQDQPPGPMGISQMLAIATDGKQVQGIAGPAAWLIGSFPPDAGSPKPPRSYGVVLGWQIEPDVIGLMIWLRGAYRTLRIGRHAIEAVLEQIARERGGDDSTPFTIRVEYPTPSSAKRRAQWQCSIWQSFFTAQGFQRRDPERNGNGHLVLERRYGH